MNLTIESVPDLMFISISGPPVVRLQSTTICKCLDLRDRRSAVSAPHVIRNEKKQTREKISYEKQFLSTHLNN